jgi:hypothetical protein
MERMHGSNAQDTCMDRMHEMPWSKSVLTIVRSA